MKPPKGEIGVLYYAKKQNGRKIQVYRCLAGRFHDYKKREKSYKYKDLDFIGRVNYYNGPDPRQFLKE